MFKDKCLALMDKVRDERVQVVITKHGHAVARLVPADVQVPNGFGYMRGTLLQQGDIVSPDFETWGEA
jgi:antitoxin (DNA-binding transcriptional repressor) of toxin-antitoxin stability system